MTLKELRAVLNVQMDKENGDTFIVTREWLDQILKLLPLERPNMTKPMAAFSDRDLFVMALTLYGEARGLPEEGQTKVAWVIRNRAERKQFVGSQFGTPGCVTTVCLAPWQFSCWNVNDPNSRVLNDRLRRFDDLVTPEPMGMTTQLKVARDVLEGLVPDPTNGADHYHTIAAPSWATTWPPEWANEYKVTARDPDDSGHIFYSSLERV